MKKITAIIEKATDGSYSIYLPKVEGVYGSGTTEQEAKDELMEAIDSAREYAEENGWNGYEALKGKYELEYRYDLSGFFLAFDIFDVSALAKRIGINASLMRRYKNGKAYISDLQKKRIEEGIHHIASELSTVRF